MGCQSSHWHPLCSSISWVHVLPSAAPHPDCHHLPPSLITYIGVTYPYTTSIPLLDQSKVFVTGTNFRARLRNKCLTQFLYSNSASYLGPITIFTPYTSHYKTWNCRLVIRISVFAIQSRALDLETTLFRYKVLHENMLELFLQHLGCNDTNKFSMDVYHCLVYTVYIYIPPVFLPCVPCLFLSHTPFLLLCALKLIVMRRVVCQSWWWICLWVERADFPWVVFLPLSLLLFFFLSFSLHQSIQSKITSLPSLPPPALSTPAGCFIHLTSGFNSSQTWPGGATDHCTIQRDRRIWLRYWFPYNNVKSVGNCLHNPVSWIPLIMPSSCVNVIFSLLQQQLWEKAPGCTMNRL